MTVKEVFDLRRQGRIEEAYEAIRPMYAVHQGRYTTLCMFWTASDILRKRIREQRFEEAGKIVKALLRILPNIEDSDGKARSCILHAAVKLDKEDRNFSMLDFVSLLKVEQLGDEDWKTGTASAVAGSPGHPIPSVAQQMLTCAFHEIQEQKDGDFMTKKSPLSHDEVLLGCLKVMPLLQEAVRRNPRDKRSMRYMAVVYTIMGEREKAAELYRQLLLHSRDSYLYAELAKLTDDPGHKAALYCAAVQNQRQEKFRTGYRLELARLLLGRDNSRAAFELQKLVETRKALGYYITHDIEEMLRKLAGIQPATEASQQEFYRKMIAKY